MKSNTHFIPMTEYSFDLSSLGPPWDLKILSGILVIRTISHLQSCPHPPQHGLEAILTVKAVLGGTAVILKNL